MPDLVSNTNFGDESPKYWTFTAFKHNLLLKVSLNWWTSLETYFLWDIITIIPQTGFLIKTKQNETKQQQQQKKPQKFSSHNAGDWEVQVQGTGIFGV